MTYRFFFILFFFTSYNLFSQDYLAEIINHDIECEVDKHNKLTVTKRLLLKINSPLGRDYADFQIYYDNMSSIKDIDCNILNLQNDLIKSFKRKEISDYSALTGYFHTDDRYKEIKAYHNSYPYIIELRYRQEFDEFFSFPTWYPQNGKNLPLRKSSYNLTVPLGYSFHHKFYNFQPEEKVKEYDSFKTYSWKTVNLPPIIVQESFLPTIKEIYPNARFVPENFVFGGIAGNSKTWKDIGNWQSKLNAGLDKLPETEIQKLKELTKKANNDYEKIKLIYEYLQNETRYIGVFIGIGGWRPLNANYVCEHKYGDCKALTNYMMAMLKAVGITSYYSLIVSGNDEPDIDTDLPGMYFNHVTLNVPLKNDTLWLECTSQNIPFNYWGTFTNGKTSLVCDFENSFITQTPEFQHYENSINQTSVVNIINGKLDVNMKRELFGEAFEKIQYHLKYNSDKDFLDIATKTLPFKNYTLKDVNYEEIEVDGITGYNESSRLTFENNVQDYGSNVIISPINKNLLPKYTLKNERKNPISISHNLKITDTIQYNIPAGLELEVLPKDHYSSTKYGKYTVNYVSDKNQLIISKSIELNRGKYHSGDYPEFKTFIDNIINLENQKILLKKI